MGAVSVKLKFTFIGLLAVTVVGGSSWAIFTLLRVQHFSFDREPAAKKPPPPPVVAQPFEYVYELKDISMQVSDRSGRRSGYIQFSLTLEMPNKEARHWMDLNRAKLISTVLDVGNRFFIEDFDRKDGIDKFKDKIAAAYSQQFNAYAPTGITIQDWVLN